MKNTLILLTSMLVMACAASPPSKSTATVSATPSVPPRICSDLRISSLDPDVVPSGKPATVLIHGSAFRPDDVVLGAGNARYTVKSDTVVELMLAADDIAQPTRLELKVHGLDSCLSNSLYLTVQ